MRRRVNLRQIEVFKAVIERGTVSAAASALNVSQPAASKSLALLEADSELRLFDRVRGRLAPTEQGMRLYAEIDRIFSGVQQVENAIDALHRQAQGRILVGVMPGLSLAFVQRVVSAFLQVRPGTFCAIEARPSEWIAEALVGHRLDVGFLSARMQNPLVESEVLAEEPLVCIVPEGHALAARAVVRPRDLVGVPFVAFGPETDIGHEIGVVLEAHGVRPEVAIVTNVAPTVCEFVASGAGVALIHPLMLGGFTRLVARPFEPRTLLGFLMSHGRASRNARLVDDFIEVARTTGAAMLQEGVTPGGEAGPARVRRGAGGRARSAR